MGAGPALAAGQHSAHGAELHTGPVERAFRLPRQRWLPLDNNLMERQMRDVCLGGAK